MSVIFKMFIFPKRDKYEDKKKQKYFFFLARKGLTLLLRISIRDGKSELRSSLLENCLFV